MTAAPSGPIATTTRGSSLVTFTFLALAAIVAARPLISESLQRVELSFLSEAQVSGPTPATTVLLDLGALALSITLLTASGAWGRMRASLLIMLAIFAASVALSTAFAADRRSAANGGASLLIAAVCGLALGHGGGAAWMPRLLLAALIASGATNAVKCTMQRTQEFEDTYAYWKETQRPELIKKGADVSAPAIVNYERRLRSGDAFGYLAHPNVTGSILAALLAPALAITIPTLLRLRREPSMGATGGVIGVGVCGLLAIGVVFTGSRGAMVAMAFGVLTLLAGVGLPLQNFARPRGLFLMIASTYCAAILGGLTFGVLRGGLPGASLNFRWEYWTAAAGAYQEAPWTGLGRLNFVSAYLRHKLPAPTEEVRDPHNLWVSLLVELGPLGFIGGGLLLAAAVFGVMRNLPRAQSEAASPPPGIAATPLTAAVALGAMTLGLQAISSQTPMISSAMMLVWFADVALVWSIGLIVTLWMMRMEGASAFWTLAGVLAALLALLLHALVEFALLTPAGAMTFAGLAACGAARAPRKGAVRRGSASAIGALVGIGSIAAYVYLCAAPTIGMERALENLQREAARSATEENGFAAVRSAADSVLAADVWDTTAPITAGEALMGRAAEDLARAPQRVMDELKQVGRILRIARGRTRNDLATLRASAVWAEATANRLEALGQSDDFEEAITLAAQYREAAVRAYPSDPRGRIAAGDTQLRRWRHTNHEEAATRAREHYQVALQVDGMRVAEVAAKLSTQERERVQGLLAELAPSSRPGPE